MDNETNAGTLELTQEKGPPIRKNVLFVEGGIVLIGAATLATAVVTEDVTATVIVAVAGMAITPLAMMAKELLTPEPGPTVHMPAETFEKLVSLVMREK